MNKFSALRTLITCVKKTCLTHISLTNSDNDLKHQPYNCPPTSWHNYDSKLKLANSQPGTNAMMVLAFRLTTLKPIPYGRGNSIEDRRYGRWYQSHEAYIHNLLHVVWQFATTTFVTEGTHTVRMNCFVVSKYYDIN